MERKLTHGGYREGAGRPSICPEKKRVQMSISVAPSTKKWLQQQARKQGLASGKLIELYIESFIKQSENIL